MDKKVFRSIILTILLSVIPSVVHAHDGINVPFGGFLSSPNKADALMLTEYFPDTVFPNAPVDGYSGMFRSEKKRGGWMSAR